jgi:hypothetical protein
MGKPTFEKLSDITISTAVQLVDLIAKNISESDPSLVKATALLTANLATHALAKASGYSIPQDTDAKTALAALQTSIMFFMTVFVGGCISANIVSLGEVQALFSDDKFQDLFNDFQKNELQ